MPFCNGIKGVQKCFKLLCFNYAQYLFSYCIWCSSHALATLTRVGRNGHGVAKQDAGSFLLHKLPVSSPSAEAVLCDYQGPVVLGTDE